MYKYSYHVMEKDYLPKDILENGGHFLCAGTTGSGKSTFLHTIMWSALAYSPCRYQFIFIDLKGGLELARYEDLPHTIAFADDVERANEALDYAIAIMTRRQAEMRTSGDTLYKGNTVFVIIDEMADLVACGGTRIVDKVTKIMRLGRATKIRTMIFTQSPNRAKGGGLPSMIQQNVTSSLALRCRSAIESRQIIGVKGAESLPQFGKGLYWSRYGIDELTLPYRSNDEIKQRIDYWKEVKVEEVSEVC